MTAGLLPTFQMIDAGGLVLLAFIILSMVWRLRTGALGFPTFRTLSRRSETDGSPAHGLLGSILSVLLLDVGYSRPLKTCDKIKWSSHVLIFWGFVFTGIATTLAYFLKPEGAVLPLDHPVKIFGNAGGILLIVGCPAMFYARFQESGSMWHLHRSDYFLIALLLTVVTGFLTENTIYAFGRAAAITPYAYWTHMSVIASLLATAPWTKFTHAFYKPSWLLYQKLTGQEQTKLEPPAPVGPMPSGGPSVRPLEPEGGNG